MSANIYNKLVTLDTENQRDRPDLAESWEMVDDTTWKFYIREGVKFHNGETLTAEDCLFSIQNNSTLGCGAPSTARTPTAKTISRSWSRPMRPTQRW